MNPCPSPPGPRAAGRRRVLVALVALALAAAAARAAGEVAEVRLMRQYGLGYLPLAVMQAEGLVERHLARAGLATTKVKWILLGAGAAANDALISGGVDVACGGLGPACIVWDRSRGSRDIRGVAALSSMPCLLVTRNPAVKSVRDLTDRDRIAMAGAGASVHTIYLQMAVAREFGLGERRRLNHLMVNLPHPEGLRALLSGGGEITAQFTSPPYWNRALAAPGIHVVLDSYDVMGGPSTFLLLWASRRFRDENPRSFAAILAALDEANRLIRDQPRRAAELYAVASGAGEKVAEILAILNDPRTGYSMVPRRTLPFAEFMHDVGTLTRRPASWKDLFFEDIHHLDGS